MIIHGRVFCDSCRAYLGQLFIVPASDFHLCPECFPTSVIDTGALIDA